MGFNSGFKGLSNLQDSREGDTTSVTQGQYNTPEISHSDHPINLQHQSRERTQHTDGKNRESEDDFQVYHIPTILNGKIENKNIEKVSNEVGYKNRENKKQKFNQHKVIMIGDSFLRGIREIVELSISNKFGIYSLLKPGCKLNTLLQSANGASGSLTHKDLIFVCGGANDFNSDMEEPTIDHIQEFIKSNKHTNIILANVPLRYDLSYHSQLNKRIRSYNKKLLEIIKNHRQVAQIKIDTDRKYHTQHGLHFNKLGKLLFSNKIT